MKINVSKDELRECVRNAVTRIVNESKVEKDCKKYGNQTKHEEAKKKNQFNKKSKGNKGNQRWRDYDDEDMY